MNLGCIEVFFGGLNPKKQNSEHPRFIHKYQKYLVIFKKFLLEAFLTFFDLLKKKKKHLGT
jgi:hypothetical protein